MVKSRFQRRYESAEKANKEYFEKILEDARHQLRDYNEGYIMINIKGPGDVAPSLKDASKLINKICKEYKCECITAIPDKGLSSTYNFVFKKPFEK